MQHGDMAYLSINRQVRYCAGLRSEHPLTLVTSLRDLTLFCSCDDFELDLNHLQVGSSVPKSTATGFVDTVYCHTVLESPPMLRCTRALRTYPHGAFG